MYLEASDLEPGGLSRAGPISGDTRNWRPLARFVGARFRRSKLSTRAIQSRISSPRRRMTNYQLKWDHSIGQMIVVSSLFKTDSAKYERAKGCGFSYSYGNRERKRGAFNRTVDPPLLPKQMSRAAGTKRHLLCSRSSDNLGASGGRLCARK